MLRMVALLIACTALAPVPGSAQPGGPALLYYSSTGDGGPGATGRDFARVMEHRPVQRLVLDVAAEPRDAAYVDAALASTGVTPEALLALRVLRRQNEKFALAFALLTSRDLDVIRQVAEIQGRRLAQAMLARRDDIRAALQTNPQPGVDWTTLAFFVVGCVSLDWDGLNLMEKRGLLAYGSAKRFIPQAKAAEGGGSLKALYWGSHNYHSRIAVTSFGDHASGPRMALPDVLRGLTAEESTMPATLKPAFLEAVGELVRQRAGALMLSLRNGAKSRAELSVASGLTPDETDRLLAFLNQLEYISQSGDRFAATIPVLTDRDKDAVASVRRIGRDVMTTWLDDESAALTRALSALTPVRNGVPLAECFYWVWHYIFGIANRELVAAGLLADPYGPERTFKGFIPAVYPLRVAQGAF